MKATFSLPFFELVAKGKLCIANVILFTVLCLLALHVWPGTADPRTAIWPENGGAELLEIVGMDS